MSGSLDAMERSSALMNEHYHEVFRGRESFWKLRDVERTSAPTLLSVSGDPDAIPTRSRPSLESLAGPRRERSGTLSRKKLSWFFVKKKHNWAWTQLHLLSQSAATIRMHNWA